MNISKILKLSEKFEKYSQTPPKPRDGSSKAWRFARDMENQAAKYLKHVWKLEQNKVSVSIKHHQDDLDSEWEYNLSLVYHSRLKGMWDDAKGVVGAGPQAGAIRYLKKIHPGVNIS